MAKNLTTDIGETERTINYIQFQLANAEAFIADSQEQNRSKIFYAHMLDLRRSLQSELYEIRRAQKAARTK